MAFVRTSVAAVILLTLASPIARDLAAQGTEPPKVVTPAFDFSGVLFANYQTRSDSSAKFANGGKASSKFDLERAYLTFRMPAGERASIRVTTDVFNGDQSGTSYYKGWAVRIKYAYLQWNFANNAFGVDGLNLATRIGILHNVIIDYEESIWPRYLSQVAEERTGGLFSSADAGAALLVTLPKKMGEVYATVVNGTGYQTAENDRFKDFAGRLTLTPFANSNALGTWGKGISISPWFYAGHTASKFQNPTGTGGANATDGLARNRYGVFVAAKDPRLTIGLSYAQRTEDVDGALVTDPRTDLTGRVTSVFAITRPALFMDKNSKAGKWGVLGRIDNFKPNTDKDGASQLTIASLFYEATSKVTFSLDAQNLTRKDGLQIAESKGLFLHVQALF